MMPSTFLRRVRPFFLVTDIGFIVYWAITALHALPPSWLFKDYDQSLAVAWNWSFLPLDLFVSATGLGSLALAKKRPQVAVRLAALSLVLTSCSGLQAISFWAARCDVDMGWWLPNLYLLLYPLPFLAMFVRSETPVLAAR
ncbi:YvaD family protein [Pendulispora brunnea]|uniref:YvaD family protein n=1 Tax=Pendulispora brunnea TaxID=2905690 RepID=A0ABZ2K376_9BACT